MSNFIAEILGTDKAKLLFRKSDILIQEFCARYKARKCAACGEGLKAGCSGNEAVWITTVSECIKDESKLIKFTQNIDEL